MNYEHLLVSNDGSVGIVQLNRPDVLNALNLKLMDELVHALQLFDADDDIRVVVIHGSKKVFAAGADIKEMSTASAIDMLIRDQFAKWDKIRKMKKPLIAAVSGFALGGGCELTMICDIIIASETARFGQPEINIGVMPGAGGTQRLTRAVGKQKAMEMVLTGNHITAQEAKDYGLVLKVVPVDLYLKEAMLLAREIAKRPPLSTRLAKESVLKAFDTTIEVGLEFERKNFYLLFASEDMKEGMQAFVEKRSAEWKGK
jgi:enoyl-CoA hydratase